MSNWIFAALHWDARAGALLFKTQAGIPMPALRVFG